MLRFSGARRPLRRSWLKTVTDPLSRHLCPGQGLYQGTGPRGRGEGRATFARLLREESLGEKEHDGIIEALDERWLTYEKPEVTERLLRLAGDFAQRYALRGYDAFQLASAFACHDGNRNVRFLSFDDKLNEAAKRVISVYQ